MATMPTDDPLPAAPAATGAGPVASLLAALGSRRIVVAVVLAVLVAAALKPIFVTAFPVLLGRMLAIAMLLLAAFAAAGAWAPGWLPRWLPRWLLQVLAVVLAAPLATLLVYLPSADFDPRGVLGHEWRLAGFLWITGAVLFVAPLLALGALYRERDAQARSEALRFALERSRLERQALDARLQLLRAQIEPHFLFNTLANVQALVEQGSPQAPAMLASLIAYLRAAVPPRDGRGETLAAELERVRPYLALMRMRMPDRLRFAIDVDPSLQELPMPALALLTLVENAVRHGIDPSEDGGEIVVRARREGDAVRLEVTDGGRGLAPGWTDGTGLANLRERLAALHGAAASLVLEPHAPRGTRAVLRLPLPD